jgi:hypothetical protein
MSRRPRARWEDFDVTLGHRFPSFPGRWEAFDAEDTRRLVPVSRLQRAAHRAAIQKTIPHEDSRKVARPLKGRRFLMSLMSPSGIQENSRIPEISRHGAGARTIAVDRQSRTRGTIEGHADSIAFFAMNVKTFARHAAALQIQMKEYFQASETTSILFVPQRPTAKLYGAGMFGEKL